MADETRSFTVEIVRESFQLSHSGKLVGGIWLRCDHEAFPEEGWSDFPIPILTWWLRELADMEQGQKQEGDLYFMDGPYKIRIERAADLAQWRVIGVRRALHTHETDWGTVPQELVKAAIVTAADAVLAVCREWKFKPAELDSLVHARRTFVGT